jgi:hypothetical protein
MCRRLRRPDFRKPPFALELAALMKADYEKLTKVIATSGMALQ